MVASVFAPAGVGLFVIGRCRMVDKTGAHRKTWTTGQAVGRYRLSSDHEAVGP